MRLKRGNKYQIVWKDAFQEPTWSEDKDLKKLGDTFRKGVKQDLIFIGQDEDFRYFTSGVHQGDKSYFDVIGIPRQWVKSIREIK